jgi:hypothetical protein
MEKFLIGAWVASSTIMVSLPSHTYLFPQAASKSIKKFYIGNACNISSMNFANETFFFVAFIVFGGIFIASIPHVKEKQILQAHFQWIISLGLMTVAFGLFAVANFIGPIALLLANTCFFAAYLYLGIFSRSLNNPIGIIWNYIAPISILIFAVAFEFVRQLGSYYDRVYLVVGLVILCLFWIIYELLRTQKTIKSIQLTFLTVTAIMELFLAFMRIKFAFEGGVEDIATLYQ